LISKHVFARLKIVLYRYYYDYSLGTNGVMFAGNFNPLNIYKMLSYLSFVLDYSL